MEQLITALEMRAEAIVEELEALEAFAAQAPDPYQQRLTNLLMRLGRDVTYDLRVNPIEG